MAPAPPPGATGALTQAQLVVYSQQFMEILCNKQLTDAQLLAALQGKYPAQKWNASIYSFVTTQLVQRGSIKRVGNTYKISNNPNTNWLWNQQFPCFRMSCPRFQGFPIRISFVPCSYLYGA